MITWFIFALLFIVIFALNMIHIEQYGFTGYLKFIKTPVPWCTLLGMVVGYFGIPVLNPALVNNWVWDHPYGFHRASILIFGALGCLVGLFFTYCFRKNLGRIANLWVTGMISLALLVGTIGVYRFQANHESTMWTQINTGFILTMGVSRDHLTISNSQQNQLIGTQIIKASVYMEDAYKFGESRYQKLNIVASALSEAGVNLVTQNNPEQLQESIQFINQTGTIIKNEIRDQSYPNKTAHFQQILNRISDKIPKDFDKAWN